MVRIFLPLMAMKKTNGIKEQKIIRKSKEGKISYCKGVCVFKNGRGNHKSIGTEIGSQRNFREKRSFFKYKERFYTLESNSKK